MTATLTPGANTALPSNDVSITVHLPGGAEVDTSALILGANGKVRGDDDMCFYGQPSVHGGAVTLSAASGKATYTMALGKLDAGAEKIVLTATIDGAQTFGDLAAVRLDSAGVFNAEIPSTGKTEKALILAELYKRNGAWKVRLLGQGFNGGLKALAEHFGVDIADEPASAPAPASPPPSPAPAPSGAPINLTKVNLTKQSSTISLKKDDGKFGRIRINLNWNQKKQKGGFLGLGSSALDLDLGAMVEDRHGNIALVQALGNQFGDFNYAPFVKLLGDDRTGAVSDGEWIEINGDYWSEMHRVLIYTFIYSGAPNWQETDGVIRVLVPNQPEVEVRMNEYDNPLPACAIVLLENTGGQIKVTREVKFFQNQQPMDEHYGWGFQWRRGSK